MKNVRLCENCGKYGMSVCDSRERDELIRRRRKCVYCGATFHTMELKIEEYEEMQNELQRLNSFIKDLGKFLSEKVGDLND